MYDRLKELEKLWVDDNQVEYNPYEKKMYDPIFDNQTDFFNFDDEQTKFKCKHEWVWYEALFQINRFQYCKHCDLKKDKI